MSILSTNNKLIKVGQDYSAGSGISIYDHVISVTGEFGKTYSAGDNISIYEQGEQLYISSKDWTNDIANASSNAYNEAVAKIPDPFDPTFISAKVDNKLDTTSFTNWQNGQYSTDLQTIEGQISNKQDSLTFAHGTSSGSISSINGSAIVDDYTYHMLNVTRVATANLYRTITANSGNWNTVTNKLDETAFSNVSGSFLTAAPSNMATTGDVAKLEQTISETYQVKGDYATVKDVESATSGKAYTSGVIDYFDKPVDVGSTESVWASAGKLHAGYTAEAIYLYAYGDKANYTIISPTGIWTKSANSGTIDIQKLSATSKGFTAAGVEIGHDKVEISGGYYDGVQIRTPNETMASAGLFFSYENVPRGAPLFSAKNRYGDGFAIWAGGAKGFDSNGNTIWDVTKAPPAEQFIVGSDSPKPSILISPYMPKSLSANFSQAPVLSSDGNGIYIGFTPQYVDLQARGLTSRNGNVRAETADGAGNVTGYSYLTGYDVGVYHSSAFGSANSGTWSLTGSVQKREIEYDADTSAITAIAGSAIGGGGVTGEFVPQSAFDELKQSYDALSSLFATYSGQWLLPNEGV